MNNQNRYKVIGVILKLLIAISSVVYIYIKLRDSDQIGALKELFLTKESSWLYITVVVLLMLLNWSLEVIKWKILVKPHEPLSFVQSAKSVLAGVTMSVFTPNRVGEFGGKIFFLQKADRIKALMSSIIGSFSQLCVTLFFGSLALSVFVFIKYDEINISFFLSVLFFMISSAMMMLYIFPNYFSKWISKIKKWSEYTSVLTLYPWKTLAFILQLSFVRYIVFSFQFLILLKLFSVEMNLGYALMTIALTFLGITIVPTITITELGVRGSAALLFLGAYSANHVGIVTASFALWLINIAVPALIGMPFIFDLTFFRRKQ